MIPVSRTLEADVVIVGGGIGGAMAAISAAESGAKRVLVLEKCHIRRSGFDKARTVSFLTICI